MFAEKKENGKKRNIYNELQFVGFFLAIRELHIFFFYYDTYTNDKISFDSPFIQRSKLISSPESEYLLPAIT